MRFEGGVGAGAQAATAEQRRAVLTINDALSLLESGKGAGPAMPPEERHKTAAELRMQKHLDKASGHLTHAAELEPKRAPSAQPLPAGRPLTGDEAHIALQDLTLHRRGSAQQSSSAAASVATSQATVPAKPAAIKGSKARRGRANHNSKHNHPSKRKVV